MTAKIKKPQKASLPRFPTIPKEDIRATISLQQERLIGRVVVAWSKLENAMPELIRAFLNVDEEAGRIVTGKQDAKHKMGLLKLLGKKHFSKEEFKKFEKLLKISGHLYADRNFIAHGTWGTQKSTNIPIAASLRERLNPEEGDPSHIVTQFFPENRTQTIVKRMMLAKNMFIALALVISPSQDKQS